MAKSSFFGKYHLIAKLGEGGMGEVWKAEVIGPAGFTRAVVLKRIVAPYADDPGFVDLLAREARLSARLNHANIVHVYELGEVDGQWFLAMEFLDGSDLRALLNGGPLPPGLAAFVVREVCRALDYAHGLRGDDNQPLGLIHRDVSPGNVMVGRDGSVKLLDFGIAKAVAGADSERTHSGAVVGKVAYLAPEMMARGRVDHRTDLYMAGIVLHEALTGQPLFPQDRAQPERAARVRPPSLQQPEVPPLLDRICMRALAPAPADRYGSAAEMAAELDEAVHALRGGPEPLAQLARERVPREAASRPRPTEVAPTTAEPRRKRAPLVAGIASLVMIVASAALLWIALRSPRAGAPAHSAAAAPLLAAAPPVSAPQPVAATPIAAPLPVAALPEAPPVHAPAPVAEAGPAPSTVRVTLRSRPAGAEVRVAGERAPRGRTPLTLDLAPGVTLQLRAPGYQTLTTRVDAVGDAALDLPMARAATRHSSRPGRAEPPPKRSVRAGALLSPFSSGTPPPH